MRKFKVLVLLILMADPYPMMIGKKINIQKKNQFLYASVDEIDFGIVKAILEESQEQLDALKTPIYGVLMEVKETECKVKIKQRRSVTVGTSNIQ